MNMEKFQQFRRGDLQVAPTGKYRQLCSSRAGFTLVELVVTIVIIGILSSIGGMFISQPIEGYIDLERRTELVDQAEMALRRMQRDIRSALPNSVRISADGKRLEMLHVVAGGRYRRSGAGDILDFSLVDIGFDVLGGVENFSDVNLGTDLVVVYNLSATGTTANAYLGDNSTPVLAGSTAINLTISNQFPYASPLQRFFIVDTAVTYRLRDGELTRHSGYPFNTTQFNPGTATGDLVASHIVLAASKFDYDAGTASRSGLVNVQLALENSGERITLLHQVHVDNAP